jgi:hypothetical protein
MSDLSAPPKAKCKKHILTGVHVECEPSYRITQYMSDIERQAKALESWARDVMEFIRDHRSMDDMDLSVVREYKDLCSVCECVWEVAEDDGVTYCANCGCETTAETEVQP